jgi:protein involved in polysaccharide export with SLBB domain/ribosomal protein L12E/L44/L45/RPP1/RPP2
MERKLIFITLLLIITGFTNLFSQDPASINVDELTEQQIKMIINEVNARGLTIEQAAQMAQIQGASPIQIEELIKRIEESESAFDPNEVQRPKPKEEEKKENTKEKISEKGEIRTEKKDKQIFGFHFFNSDKLSFEPPVNIPVPLNYIVGIGDEFIITVWGASQKNYKLKIETSGALNIPELGPIHVAGLELSKAKELIKSRLTTIYRGMGGDAPNTFCEATVSNLRSIVVNVIGEAMVPGTYTLPATASAFNALYLSGGPNENGSFRNIQVIRNNKIVKTIDVYDYLINGNTSENIQLREQDILHIPVYQKRVTVNGAFKRTGYFELSENEKLSDLLKYAGGFSEKAFKSQVSLTRITDKEKKILDINRSIFDSYVLQNGDSIVASEIIDRFENRVAISGAVFMPGNYELSDGLTLSELIKKAQGVKESYFNRGMIIRLQMDLAPMIIQFNTEDIIAGLNDIVLHREDQVVIQDRFNMKEKQTVHVYGEIQRPGDYMFADNMTLQDLLFKAGGLNEAASQSFIEVARRHNYTESSQVLDEMVKLYHFNIDRDLKIDSNGDPFYLEPFDYIYVRRAPSYHVQRTVYIEGEVRYPGAYSIGSKNERVSDLVKRAGGLMPNAYVRGANMKRSNKQAEQSLKVLQSAIEDTLFSKVETQIANSQLELRLEHIMHNPGTEFDYILKDGDQIFIPEKSQEVRISGEIRNPMGLAFEQSKSLKYYIDRNGGFGEKANKRKVFVIYSDGTTQVTRNFIWPVYPNIEPGSQIVVPVKAEKIRTDSTGKWLSIASTMATVSLVISNIIQ